MSFSETAGRESGPGTLCEPVTIAADGAQQGRFAALLEANLAISGHLALPDVLRRVVASACQLTRARYGAIAVLDERGEICELVHVGIDENTAKRIGSLPEAKGLLGLLIEEPRPLRLQRVSDHPRSAGFPMGHPEVGALLGVPIRLREGVFGNLYLADPVGGEFTQEDEDILILLASHAGTAVENARLFRQEQRGREWLEATLEITRSLLVSAGEEHLATVAQAIRTISDSDFVLVILPAGNDALMVEVAAGEGTDNLPGYTYPCEGSVAAEALRTGEVVLIPDARDMRRALPCEAWPGRSTWAR